jgi:hypothetical protein
MIIPDWLNKVIHVFSGLLVAQALIVNYFTSAGIPTRWTSAAIGLVGLGLITFNVISDTLLNAGMQPSWVKMVTYGLNLFVGSQGIIATDLVAFSPPQRIISAIFSGLSAILLVLQIMSDQVALKRAARGQNAMPNVAPYNQPAIPHV